MRKLLITLTMGAAGPSAEGPHRPAAQGAERRGIACQTISLAGRWLWVAIRWYWTRLTLVGMLVCTLLLAGGAPILISHLPLVSAHQQRGVLALTDLFLFLNMAGAMVARAGRRKS